MATTHMDLAPLLPFDSFTDPSSVGQRWTSWLCHFETYLVPMDITNAKRKRALLLYRVGQQTHEIFNSIPDHGDAEDSNTAVDKLSTYFLPKKNVDYEIFQFRQAKQFPGETVNQYSTRLRKLAANCEFSNVNNV